jgi:hypothetical protein
VGQIVFGLLDPGRREQRRKVKLDRKHLAARSRRLLRNYLAADETEKPIYYRLVEEASQKCHPEAVLTSPELQDDQIAEATSSAAMRIVLERGRLTNVDRQAEVVTDAFATVGVAYHRAAGVYSLDKTMEKLGTAAGRSSSDYGDLLCEGTKPLRRLGHCKIAATS